MTRIAAVAAVSAVAAAAVAAAVALVAAAVATSAAVWNCACFRISNFKSAGQILIQSDQGCF